MKARTILSVIAIPLLVGFAAPASGAVARPSTPSAQKASEEHTTVRVHNDNWSTVDLYVVRYGMKWRLGMVETGQTENFQVPAGFEQTSGELRLLVEPIGSPYAYITEPVMFVKGDTIQLDVGNQLGLTTFVVDR